MRWWWPTAHSLRASSPSQVTNSLKKSKQVLWLLDQKVCSSTSEFSSRVSRFVPERGPGSRDKKIWDTPPTVVALFLERDSQVVADDNLSFKNLGCMYPVQEHRPHHVRPNPVGASREARELAVIQLDSDQWGTQGASTQLPQTSQAKAHKGQNGVPHVDSWDAA